MVVAAKENKHKKEGGGWVEAGNWFYELIYLVQCFKDTRQRC